MRRLVWVAFLLFSSVCYGQYSTPKGYENKGSGKPKESRLDGKKGFSEFDWNLGFALHFPSGSLLGPFYGISGTPRYIFHQLSSGISLSVGAQPALGFSTYIVGGRYSTLFNMELPVFSEINFGRGSWSGNQFPVGLSVGLGGSYFMVNQYSLLGPSATASIQFPYRGDQTMIIRFLYTLNPVINAELGGNATVSIHTSF